MNQQFINIFLRELINAGHQMICDAMSIDSNNFDVLCSSKFFSEKENYQKLVKHKQGCYLYINNCSTNPNFVQNFKTFLENKIVNEIDIISNIFNNKPIKILIVKIKEDDFRLIYEIHSADRLKIL
jgi:hypothetical protein